jgi:hypothetical protein
MINYCNISNTVNTCNIYCTDNAEGSTLTFPRLILFFTFLRCEYEHF